MEESKFDEILNESKVKRVKNMLSKNKDGKNIDEDSDSMKEIISN
ncbi:MAG: hypothetical protein WCS62_00300 [Bacilli bacterium]